MCDLALNLGFNSSSYDLEKKRNSRDSFAVPRISISQLNEQTKTPVSENDDQPERATWSKGIQSLLLCLSMSVGLGNIWRFPNVAYNNGGGAFLIPYLLLLFIIGRPLYYLELIMGQFSSQGPIKVWRMVPAFKGKLLL
ncbi:UNVERIFIED_CONTAM: Sodium-dependent nutrient amino acid transporter 1 [Trichonephila clavipes]